MKRTPLKRRTPVKPKRRKPRRSARVRDEAYLRWVRTLPCCAPHVPEFVVLTWPCGRTIQAHHAGIDRGYGQKSSDHDAIPLCTAAHRAWHDCAGPFEGWSKAERSAWARDKILETQALAIAAGVLA